MWKRRRSHLNMRCRRKEEFIGRIRHILTKYPYLVLEENGELLGYAYAGDI